MSAQHGLFHGQASEMLALKLGPLEDNGVQTVLLPNAPIRSFNDEQIFRFPVSDGAANGADFALSCKFHIPKQERVEMRDELLKEFGTVAARERRRTVLIYSPPVVSLGSEGNVSPLAKRLLPMVCLRMGQLDEAFNLATP
ncbi:ADM_HP2_G0024750.mRNA.1.CDS.1 [Saccharomyces cerevisiae]|nr:ADM_HP2_G0024750.mRNA.1.CDS.1 [Saccharomyces cerevisiae]CAI6450435.1 ADM_HP2_G0024750.mRNA.1.CDS.1 [Saccharomyces cerevisiae]